MPVKKRNRQQLDLDLDTHTIKQDGKYEHKGNISRQLEKYPNRWSRISFAARNKSTSFDRLMCHIKVDSFREAFKVLDGSKALGTDGISKKVYGKHLEENLKDLVNRIQNGSYKPQVKRLVEIPKANGGTRPIAISCVEDKLVEWVLGKTLESIYEPLFIRNSFGFRPYRSAHNAVTAIHCSLKDNSRPFVVEIDFANFFNSIPHRKLMKILSKRIADERFKGLLGRFLKVGILEQSGHTCLPEEGTPQGSIMSPILANVYLHYVLDTWFLNNYASFNNIIVRYADDAVFFFKSEQEAKLFLSHLEKHIQTFGLVLNKDKTAIISFGKNKGNSFGFLGFTFYWGRKRMNIKQPLKVKTNQKTLHRKIQEFYNWIKLCRNKMKLKEIWKLAKAKLTGHYHYYGYGDNLPKLNHFYYQAIRSLFIWLNRRSQKSSYTWEQFQDRLKFDPLPMPPSMADLKHLRRSWAYV